MSTTSTTLKNHWNLLERTEYRGLRENSGTYYFKSSPWTQMYLSEKVYVNGGRHIEGGVYYNANRYEQEFCKLSNITKNSFLLSIGDVTELFVAFPFRLDAGETISITHTRDNGNRSGYQIFNTEGILQDYVRKNLSGAGTDTITYKANVECWFFWLCGKADTNTSVTISDIVVNIERSEPMVFSNAQSFDLPEGEVKSIGLVNNLVTSYQDNYRLTNDGTLAENAYSTITNYFPCTPGSILYVEGCEWGSINSEGLYTYVGCYASETNENYVFYFNSDSLESVRKGVVITIDPANPKRFSIDFTNYTGPDFSYIRLSLKGRGAKLIVSNNGYQTIMWKAPSKYTNLVPLSTDADGNIYNEVGFKNGYRVRSEGEETEISGCTCIGFIPVTEGDIIEISGCDFSHPTVGNAINAADENYTIIGQFTAQPVNYGIFLQAAYKDYGYSSVVQEQAGVWKWVVPSGISYIRINGVTNGEGHNLIVTKNEEITFGQRELPTIFQEVEYLKVEAGVSTYIDLGLVFDSACKVKLGLYRGNDDTLHCFGCAEQDGIYRCMITSVSSITYGYGSTNTTYWGRTVPTIKNSFMDLEYSLVGGGGLSYIQNLTTGDRSEAVYGTQADYTMTTNLTLFAQNYNGTIRGTGASQIHYFKYYNKDNKLICDLVPCYRKSDKVAGMYDYVRKIFLTNVGEGNFIYGKQV